MPVGGKKLQGEPGTYAVRKSGRGRLVLAALVWLAIIAATVFALFRFYLGGMISKLLVKIANDNLNGTVEFERISLNVFTGTARVSDIRIFDIEGGSPVVEVPEVEIDVWPLLGKNFTATIKNARISAVRNPDGSINLLRLLKPREEKREPAWNATIDWYGITIDADDNFGIPPEQLARMRGENGSITKAEKFIALLGLEADKAQTKRFSHSITLERISGALRFKAAGREATARFKGRHGQTDFSGDAFLNLESGRASANLTWGREDFEFIRAYAEQALPVISKLDPRLEIERVQIEYARMSDGTWGAKIDVDLPLASATFYRDTPFALTDSKVTYDTGAKLLEIKNAGARFGEAAASLSGSADFANETLDFQVAIRDFDLSVLPAANAPSGILSGDFKVGGTFSSPMIRGGAKATGVFAAGHAIGSVEADFTASPERAAISRYSVYGGEIAVSGSGIVTNAPSAEFNYVFPPTQISRLERLAGAKKGYVEGLIGSSGRVSYADGSLSVSGNALSPRLIASNVEVEGVRAEFKFDGRSLAIPSLRFDYSAPGGVTIETTARVKAANLSGGKIQVEVESESRLIGLEWAEHHRPPAAAAADLFGIVPETGLAVDPNAPKRGVVIESTDPSRIGMETWWPRKQDGLESGISDGQAEVEEAEIVESVLGILAPPVMKTVAWLREGELAPKERGGKSVPAADGAVPVVKYVGLAVLDPAARGGQPPNITLEGRMTAEGILLRPVDVEIKSEGAAGESWIYATATGKYKDRGFMARAGYRPCLGCDHEFNVYLLYGSSDFAAKGTVDIEKAAVSAKIESTAIQLEDLLDVEGMYGSATLQADLSGAIADPEVNGVLLLDSADYQSPRQSQSLISFSDGRFPFKADASGIKLSDGMFHLGGTSLSLNGSVEKGTMNVVLAGDSFSLGDLTRNAFPEVEISGKGSLSASLTGTTRNPDLHLAYFQSEGEINGVPFSEAELTAEGDLSGIAISKLNLSSKGGRISASGNLDLIGDFPLNAGISVTDFQAGVVTPLLPKVSEAKLLGIVNGDLEVSGTLKSPEFRVTGLTMRDGSILGQPLDEAFITLSYAGDEVKIDNFSVQAGESTVVAQGTINKSNFSESQLSIDASFLDLSLINPFLPERIPGEFRGSIGINTIVKYGDFGPYMQGSLQSAGELGYADISLIGASGNFTVRGDRIELADFVFIKEKGSSLHIDGTIPLPSEASEAISEIEVPGISGPSEQASPGRFDLHMRSDDFEIAYLTALMPNLDISSGGTLTADLKVTGSLNNPLIEGAVRVSAVDAEFWGVRGEGEAYARDLKSGPVISAGEVTGTISLKYNPNLDANTFEFGEFKVSETTAGGVKKGKPAKPKPLSAAGQPEVKEHTIEIGGGGTFRLRPFRLYQLDVTAILKRFEKFTLPGVYRGPLEGYATFTKSLTDINVHVGGSMTLGTGGVFTLKAPDPDRTPVSLPITLGERASSSGQTTAENAGPIAPPQRTISPQILKQPLKPFEVYIEKGVTVRFPPLVDLRAEIQGAKDKEGKVSPLKIKGDWPNLELEGVLESYKGSLILHRHTFRIVEPPFEIRFDPKNVDEFGVQYAYAKGKAAVVLPGGAGGSGMDDFDLFDNDLTIYVNMDNPLTLNALGDVRLTSDPPLPDDEIKRRMLGVLPPEGSVQGLSPEIRDELYNLVSARVSRLLEEKLDVEQFSLRIGERQELYVDIEKEISDRLSLLYSATYFTSDGENEKEQFGLKYTFLKRRLLSAYVEALYDNTDSGFYGNELNVVLRRKF
ncbi:MAG: hypothetical protein HRF49_09165 [bacterium]|jgi:hypothetical protein